MQQIIFYTTVGFIAIFSLSYARLVRGISYPGGVPRVGGSGTVGYIITALKYTLDAESVILEGRAKFLGQPFAIPTLSGPVFLLGPEYLDRVKSSNDDVFNEPMAVNEDLQLPYTMNEAQLQNPYQAAVVRTNVNRAIPTFIPEILEESDLAMEETFKSTKEVPVFDTMTHLIARISNRVIFGIEMCRNESFLHEIVRFAETTPLIAPFITWSPVTLRPLVYFIMSALLGGKKGSLKFIIPFLKRYTDERAVMDDKPHIVAEFLINSAPPQETLEGIAIRLMNINFGSIHTSSIFITQALFELALLPREQLDDMRSEIEAALESEGGWNKAALLKFKKVDSVLREVGRVYGLMHFALPRFAILGCELDNGLSVPPGHRIAIDMKAVHFNPKVYPDPETFDAFRFSKLRAFEESDTKYGFATVDNNYLPFGAGRHACAGRFFAAMELKIMLAHIMLKYDFAFPPGVVARPRNIVFNGAIVPDPKAHLTFTRRDASSSNPIEVDRFQ